MVARGIGGVRGWAKRVTVVKRYKLPFIRQISPGNIMSSMVTTVYDTVLYICKLLR